MNASPYFHMNPNRELFSMYEKYNGEDVFEGDIT